MIHVECYRDMGRAEGKEKFEGVQKKKKKKMPSTHFYIVWAGRMGMGDSAVTHACQSVLGQRY